MQLAQVVLLGSRVLGLVGCGWGAGMGVWRVLLPTHKFANLFFLLPLNRVLVIIASIEDDPKVILLVASTQRWSREILLVASPRGA